MTNTPKKTFALRLLGVVLLLIGLWLLKGLAAEFMVLYTSAQTKRDFNAIWALALCSLMLIGGGGVLICKPDLLKE